MTKAQIKHIRNLGTQKFRKLTKTYLVEGEKNVIEWLSDPNATIRQLIALPEWLNSHEEILNRHPEVEIIPAQAFELEKVTVLQHPQKVLCTVAFPTTENWIPQRDQWYLFLDRIQDPGNLGTIIRTADWFGITDLLLSPECVEIFNPKVVQASMGSLLRVNATTLAPVELLTACRTTSIPIYATSLDGNNIAETRPLPPGVIALGNESAGLSSLLLSAASQRLRIPGKGKAESLNVGVATGILCAQLTL